MSEINDIIELPEVIYLLQIIYQYQQKDPISMAKHNNRTHKNSSSHGVSNIKFKLIMCKDNFELHQCT